MTRDGPLATDEGAPERSTADGEELSRRRRARIPLSTRALGLATMLAERLLPSLGAALAYRLWFRTVRPAETEAAFELLRRARHRELDVSGRRTVVYSWGSGPTVLLVHGWSSHAGRMTPFVEPILDQGFQVVAPDLPGHGRSEGRRSNIFEFRDALLAVDDMSGPVEGVVAHSLGTLATLAACRSGLEPSSGVLISPAIDLDALVGIFEQRAGLSASTSRRLQARVAAFVGEDFYPGLMDHGPPRALVIHDADDDEIPSERARETVDALPDARLVNTAGLGHHRILQDSEVVAETVDFLAQARRT